MNTRTYYEELSNQPNVATLQQLTCLTWDGDLISKEHTKLAIQHGLAQKIPGGWNLITAKGVQYMETLGFITNKPC